MFLRVLELGSISSSALCRPIADVTLDRLLTPALRCQQ